MVFLRLSGAGENATNGDYFVIGANPSYSNSAVYQNSVTGYCIGYNGFRTDPNGAGAVTLQWGVFRTGGALDGSDLADPIYYGDTDPTIGPDDGEWDWRATASSDIPPFGALPAPTTSLIDDQDLPPEDTAVSLSAFRGFSASNGFTEANGFGAWNGFRPENGF